MTTETQALIAQIRALPDAVAALVQGLTVEQLTTPLIPEEWTIAQIVHHLADSHMNSFVRCKLIATESQPTLKPYDQEAWARLADGSEGEIAPSLQILQGLHHRWTHFFEQLPDEAWQRSGNHPEDGAISLRRLLQRSAAHGESHLQQIKRLLAASSEIC